ANETIVLGAIGCGGQGTNLIKKFAALDGVELAYVCDPDEARAGAAADAVAKIAGKTPKVVTDLRKVFDDQSIDAVTVATPARWGLGVDTHPSTVASLGGKYFFDDDQQFPDTQYALFEYPGDGKVGSRRQLHFEMRIWSPYQPDGVENGNLFYGTDGWMLLSK